jgi:transposase
VVKLANDAIDTTRRWAWNQARPHPEPSPRQRRRHPLKTDRHTVSHKIKHSRWALLKDPADLKASQKAVLAELRATRHVLWRAYEIKESLRDLYRLPDPSQAPAHLDAWLARACRSRIPAMVKLSQTIRQHRDQILAAVELGLSNAKLEGLNSKIRLINHRGYGHHTPAALIALIYLCAGGITIELPTQT